MTLKQQHKTRGNGDKRHKDGFNTDKDICLLYTSDAADE